MYCLLNKRGLSSLKPVTTFPFFLIWVTSYVSFFFFSFCSIAGHTVELNPEGEWMEKNVKFEWFHEWQRMLNKADLEQSYFTYYFCKFLLSLVWPYEAVNIWDSWT